MTVLVESDGCHCHFCWFHWLVFILSDCVKVFFAVNSTVNSCYLVGRFVWLLFRLLACLFWWEYLTLRACRSCPKTRRRERKSEKFVKHNYWRGLIKSKKQTGFILKFNYVIKICAVVEWLADVWQIGEIDNKIPLLYQSPRYSRMPDQPCFSVAWCVYVTAIARTVTKRLHTLTHC